MTANEKRILCLPSENLTPENLETRIRLRNRQIISWGPSETMQLIWIVIFMVILTAVSDGYILALLPLVLVIWFVFLIQKTAYQNRRANEIDIRRNPVAYEILKDGIDLTKYINTIAFTAEFIKFDKAINHEREMIKLTCKHDIDQKYLDCIYKPYNAVADEIANKAIYKDVWVKKPEGWDDRLKIDRDYCGFLSILTYYDKHNGGEEK